MLASSVTEVDFCLRTLPDVVLISLSISQSLPPAGPKRVKNHRFYIKVGLWLCCTPLSNLLGKEGSKQVEVICLNMPGLAKGKKSGSLKWEMSCALG